MRGAGVAIHPVVEGSDVGICIVKLFLFMCLLMFSCCCFYFQTELRAEERLAEEQKRHRELLARVEREAKLQNENCQIRIRTMEMEVTSLREEIQRLRLQSDKQAADLHATEEKLEKARDSLMISQQDLAEARAEEKK